MRAFRIQAFISLYYKKGIIAQKFLNHLSASHTEMTHIPGELDNPRNSYQLVSKKGAAVVVPIS